VVALATVAGRPPMVTVSPAPPTGKLAPVMVMGVPGAPLSGVKPAMVGGPAGGVGEWSHESVAGGMFQNLEENSRRAEQLA